MNPLFRQVLSWSAVALLPLGAALAQDATTPKTVAPQNTGPKTVSAPPAAVPAAPETASEVQPAAAPKGGTELTMRGLDKITGRPTSITAPIGKPVRFATLTITARYCYSTPASETPETSAFLQIDDHRPDQGAKHVFSGWMYASSPSLNGMEHPLYDVWVINCSNGAPNTPVAAMTSAAPVKVKAPDSSDKEGIEALPEEAGR